MISEKTIPYATEIRSSNVAKAKFEYNIPAEHVKSSMPVIIITTDRGLAVETMSIENNHQNAIRQNIDNHIDRSLFEMIGSKAMHFPTYWW